LIAIIGRIGSLPIEYNVPGVVVPSTIKTTVDNISVRRYFPSQGRHTGGYHVLIDSVGWPMGLRQEHFKIHIGEEEAQFAQLKQLSLVTGSTTRWLFNVTMPSQNNDRVQINVTAHKVSQNILHRYVLLSNYTFFSPDIVQVDRVEPSFAEENRSTEIMICLRAKYAHVASTVEFGSGTYAAIERRTGHCLWILTPSMSHQKTQLRLISSMGHTAAMAPFEFVKSRDCTILRMYPTTVRKGESVSVSAKLACVVRTFPLSLPSVYVDGCPAKVERVELQEHYLSSMLVHFVVPAIDNTRELVASLVLVRIWRLNFNLR